ncbi:hypothetical protein GCM10023215_58160 [Pseudonocardia yuanmonensis]|uniref:Uncharacterized protein n=1 Tax=Pseudonocardia yuanmonensis TaxID=1095914 RepID=A0ABP8XJX2_9PSEU
MTARTSQMLLDNARRIPKASSTPGSVSMISELGFGTVASSIPSSWGDARSAVTARLKDMTEDESAHHCQCLHKLSPCHSECLPNAI